MYTELRVRRYRVIMDRVGPESSCLKARGGNLDWVLVVALDLGVFFEDYTKRSEMALIVALGAIVMSITLSVMGLGAMLRTYEKIIADGDGDSKGLASQMEEIDELNPDSEGKTVYIILSVVTYLH